MLERFTTQARTVVMRAREERRQLRHPHIGTEHLLLAMLSEDAGIAYDVLREAGVDAAAVRAEVQRLVGPAPAMLSEEDAAALRTIGIDLDAVLARVEETFGPDALDPPPPAPPARGLLGRRRRSAGRLTPRARKVLELALREALRLKHNYIGTEHILLGLIREGEGLAAKILFESGVDLADLRRATEARLRRAA
ncbi:MAG: Clp protease [Micromonosporaceae bacterium]|nr:Clp protease [Micromonosporaceae bacterium]